jgi:hypothetical protein
MSPKKVDTTNRVSNDKKGVFREGVGSRKKGGTETAKNRSQKPASKPKRK